LKPQSALECLIAVLDIIRGIWNDAIASRLAYRTSLAVKISSLPIPIPALLPPAN
jgi:hypothetical protein